MLRIDTDIAVDLQRLVPAAQTWFDALPIRPGIPGFVVLELIAGCRNAAEGRTVQQFCQRLPIVWPSEADRERAGRCFSRYQLSAGIGLLEALIAASAVGRRATLCTSNRKHAGAIPGLAIQEPYQR